jgi:hypothetical protein
MRGILLRHPVDLGPSKSLLAHSFEKGLESVGVERIAGLTHVT